MSYTYQYPHPALTTDSVIFGFDGKNLNVLLIKRGIEPFKDQWALPGGFIHIDETVEECALRELKEETHVSNIYIEQFGIFSDINRDPRERVISIGFLALVAKKDFQVIGGDDAKEAKWYKIDQIPQMAFDHEEIFKKALTALKRKIHFEPIGFKLLDEKFTMSQLQNLYECILQTTFDRRNFYKKMLSLEILNAETRPKNAPRRQATIYTFNQEKYNELKSSGFKLEF